MLSPAGASPSGKAPDFESGIRRFESSRPNSVPRREAPKLRPARLPAVVLVAVAWVLAAATVVAAIAPGDPIHPRAYLSGRLLVADDSMDDPRFASTVILMVAHDEGGAFGLVVNRPLGRRPFRELLQGLGDKDGPSVGEAEIHYGGPVEPLRGYVLHGPDYRSLATRDVNSFTVMTPTLDVIRLLARGDGPRAYLIAFGYAGWAPGQLEGEIAAGAWFVIDADAALVFGKDHAGKWQRARARRGVDL